MPQSFSCDSPISGLRGGIVIAEPFLRVCEGVNIWGERDGFFTSHVLQSECILACSVYVPANYVPASRYVSVMCRFDCVCVCVCRLEQLWMVGFMSQQVTDDQIN